MTVAPTSRPRAFLRPFTALLVTGVCAGAGSGQSVKLSGALAQPLGGNVGFFAVTPDGTRVVYVGDQEVDERFELYGVPSDGSQTPVKISDPLDGNVHHTRGLVTPDGDAVLYLTDAPALFRAPLDGSSAPLQLAGGLALDLDQLSYDEPFRFDLSPDAQWVVYRENDPPRLWSVRVDGSAPPVALSNTAAVIPRDFRISPDGQRVVFRAGISDIKQALYSVPIDGSAGPTRLNPGYFDARQTMGSFLITADSQRVVYSSDQDVPEVFEVYSVPIGGGLPSTGYNGTLPAFADAWPVALTADSTRVLFTVDLAFNERRDLYVSPLDASAPPLRLGANHPSIWPNGIQSVQVHDDSRVVYMTSGREVYSAPIGGGGFVRLSQPGANVLEFQVSPGGHVLFQAYLEGRDEIDLFSVPVNGGYQGRAARAPRIRRLAAGVFNHFWIHPNGSTVLYRDSNPTRLVQSLVSGDGPVTELVAEYVNFEIGPGDRVFYSPLSAPEFPATELYSMPLAGGPAVRLNTQLPLGPVLGRVHDFQTSPDGAWAVYLADGEIRWRYELYASPTDGSAPPRQISAETSTFSGDVGGYDPQPGAFRFTPDSARVVYLADHLEAGTHDLYVVPIDASTPAVQLTQFTDNGGVRHGFELTPDGQHAVFLGWVPSGEFSYSMRLHSVRLDGSAPPFLLSGTPDNWAGVDSFAISPDSTRVVYGSDEQSYHHYELRSVPIEGGPIVELQSSSAYTATLGDYALSPDGAWVVYLFNAGSGSSVPQLHAIPSDGSGPRRTFGGESGSPTAFQITPDGSGVVYLFTLNGLYGHTDLYHAPIDASSWLRLDPPGAEGPNGSPATFRLSPDGTRVAYLADQEVDGLAELYSVPLDGSQQLVKLSQTLPNGTSIWPDFVVTPDGERVLYFTDAAFPGRHELYSVPLDGAEAPVRLNGPIAPGGGFALAFQQPLPLAIQGPRVAFVLDQEVPGQVELFVAPLDGWHEARRLNEPLQDGPSASLPFAFAGPNQLVYLAPQDLPGVPELFARALTRTPPHRRR